MKVTKPNCAVFLLAVGLGLAVNGYSQSFLTNGLVAFYPFNGNANDVSGHGLSGTVHGAVPTVDRFGITNGAYYFNGAAYITVPVTSSLVAGDFTASAWFNAYDLTNGWPTMLDEQNQVFRLQIAGDTCGCSRPGVLVSYSGSAEIQYWSMSTSRRTPTKTFCHIVVSKAGSTMTMYLNGLLVAATQVVSPITQAGSYLNIGQQFDLPSFTAFHGIIDDIRFYNRALAVDEVQQLYAYERGPVVDLVKAVKPSFSGLWLGTNYQLQLSGDLSTWTNQGDPFKATNTTMVYPQYFDVDNWGRLFYRLQVAP